MRVQNLFSLLVLPVQRLPRYEMMFSDLIRHTPAGHEGELYRERMYLYIIDNYIVLNN